MNGKLINAIKMLICIIFMLSAIYLIYNYYSNKEIKSSDPNKGLITEDENRKLINAYKDKYNNDEIFMILEIPDVFKIPVVQTDDNKYYYNHDLYKNSSKIGTPFLDYRNKSLNDKKIIVYDQKGTGYDAFSSIENYQNSNYYFDHPLIKVYTESKDKTYRIFSSYIEEKDFDFTNLNSYSGLTYYEHINKLKNKSLYETEVYPDNNSKIIILDLSIKTNNGKKDMLVMGVEIPDESNKK